MMYLRAQERFKVNSIIFSSGPKSLIILLDLTIGVYSAYSGPWKINISRRTLAGISNLKVLRVSVSPFGTVLIQTEAPGISMS